MAAARRSCSGVTSEKTTLRAIASTRPISACPTVQRPASSSGLISQPPNSNHFRRKAVVLAVGSRDVCSQVASMFHGSANCTTSRQVNNAQATLVKWRASGIEGLRSLSHQPWGCLFHLMVSSISKCKWSLPKDKPLKYSNGTLPTFILNQTAPIAIKKDSAASHYRVPRRERSVHQTLADAYALFCRIPLSATLGQRPHIFQ